MSGHNKWSKIKHKKASEDAWKGKIFSMLGRQIAIESKAVKGDMNSPRLRTIIEKARKANMPNDNIKRAVDKGAGTGGESYESVRYEGFGPGGVALIIEGITDNSNRTGPEIRHIFTKAGFALGTPGSASWAFDRVEEEGAPIWKPKNTMDLSDEDLAALTTLVEALEAHDDIEAVYTNAE